MNKRSFKPGDIVSASEIITTTRGHTGNKLRITSQTVTGCVLVCIDRNQQMVEYGQFDFRNVDHIATLRKKCDHCGWQVFKAPYNSIKLEIEMDDPEYKQ